MRLQNQFEDAMSLETQRQGQVFEELFFVFIDNKNKCQENYEHKDKERECWGRPHVS